MVCCWSSIISLLWIPLHLWRTTLPASVTAWCHTSRITRPWVMILATSARWAPWWVGRASLPVGPSSSTSLTSACVEMRWAQWVLRFGLTNVQSMLMLGGIALRQCASSLYKCFPLYLAPSQIWSVAEYIVRNNSWHFGAVPDDYPLKANAYSLHQCLSL